MTENQKEKLTDSAAFISGRQSIVVMPVANQFGAAARCRPTHADRG
jgi:hypothetical protein